MIMTEPQGTVLERGGNMESGDSINDISSDGLITLADVVLDVTHQESYH